MNLQKFGSNTIGLVWIGIVWSSPCLGEFKRQVARNVEKETQTHSSAVGADRCAVALAGISRWLQENICSKKDMCSF